jgi:pyruvate dehydrogenase E2 component (dihydrolipoamide acetyltransferase)
MPADVIMPALGLAQETGKVVRWLKHEGETVVKGEPLLEVETDKVTVEIEAPAAGTLEQVSAPDGSEVPVGSVIALVVGAGEQVPEPVAAAPVAVVEESRGRLASPKARRIAETLGVDLDAIVGSGPNGAVTAADVELAGADTGGGAEPQVDRVWRLMADRTARSWREVPHFFLERHVDATQLERRREAARQQPGGEATSHTDLLVRHCAEVLRRHPRVNASWHEGAIVPGADVNVAIAVATDEGLVAPVVHRADTLTLAEITQARAALTRAAREGGLRPEDVQGGTFTISNLGMYGVDAFQAIVNAPQAAILAVGRIADRPAAIGGQVVVRAMLTLTVSFDHRVVDGARGAEFLDTLAGLVEEPAAP